MGIIRGWVKKYWLTLLILGVGVFLRSWRAKELFMYSHDQDLSAWIVMDVLENKHLRLIGQETSVPGVFIGMLYYYSLIPFYLLFGGGPMGGVYWSIIIGAGTIVSYWWVFKKIFGERMAWIGSFLYAASYYTVFVDREVVPTTPVMLWCVWYLYAIWCVLKGKQGRGFVLGGVLVGLIWHFNLGLLVVVPLLPVAWGLTRRRLDWKAAVSGGGALLVSAVPLVLFELRHGFIQTRAVLGSLGAEEAVAVTRWEKFDRVMQLLTKNVRSIFATHLIDFPQIIVVFVLLGLLALLWLRKKEYRNLMTVMYLWVGMYVGFFSFNAINLSEYYLNGLTVVWITAASLGVAAVVAKERWRWVGYLVLLLFAWGNWYKFRTIEVNRSGYVQRRELVAFVKADAGEHSYPCVSISYITELGYDLGYRYLFRLEEMHVNRPDSGSPVYTIVFPHSMVDRIDKSFGALGLIYPDYERYGAEEVEKSCAGANSNLTDPLFGFTR